MRRDCPGCPWPLGPQGADHSPHTAESQTDRSFGELRPSCDLKHAAAFTGVIPRPFIGADGSKIGDRKDVSRDAILKEAAKNLEFKYAVLNVGKIVSKFGSLEVRLYDLLKLNARY